MLAMCARWSSPVTVNATRCKLTAIVYTTRAHRWRMCVHVCDVWRTHQTGCVINLMRVKSQTRTRARRRRRAVESYMMGSN